LELRRRYLQRIDLPGRRRRALAALGSDDGWAQLSLLMLALLSAAGAWIDRARAAANALEGARSVGG